MSNLQMKKDGEKKEAAIALPSTFFFFQAEDGIRYGRVTGVQTCALPIWTWATARSPSRAAGGAARGSRGGPRPLPGRRGRGIRRAPRSRCASAAAAVADRRQEIGRASCRERGEVPGGGGSLKRKRGAEP